MRWSQVEVLTDDKDNLGVRVSDELSLDRINVGFVVGNTVVGDSVLSVRGKCCAITVGQIIDNKNSGHGWARTSFVESPNVREERSHQGDL
jgi:hypothetical protein